MYFSAVPIVAKDDSYGAGECRIELQRVCVFAVNDTTLCLSSVSESGRASGWW